ncbi:MAG: diacylglycerol/lipid kinase family protein, partial [Aridibacter sp.]
VKSDTEIIVAGGGDGTINAVVSKIIGSEKTLGVLPLGTLNHFSKDLKIPQGLPEAVRVIAEKNTKKIDVGEVNGRIFVNNSNIGFYSNMVKDREDQQESFGRGKWSAAFWALLKILQKHPFLSVKLINKSGKRTVRTPFVFIGNNKYEMDFFNNGSRKRLDSGKLGVYFLHKSGRKGLLALFLRTLFGRLRQAKDFEEIGVEEITIKTHKDQILVALDGEVETLKTPLCYKIHPLALNVIVPGEET